ncbi:MAG: AAA family ATPase [Cyclobacteriaceae bacterium]|nr:AAA family ATPase [Cyclobacteriaceae bacterium]
MTKVNQNAGLDKELIRNAIQEYCKSKNQSQTELAPQAGVSSATISKMVKGNWDDIRDGLWRKVWIVVSDGIDVLINTSDHAAIRKLCKRARNQKLMIGLTGDTGMGKTTSLKVISRSPNTYFVSFDKTMRARQFFAEILREMAIPFEGNLNDMVSKIAGELNMQADPLLIIDEAGKLTHNLILYLHVLRDKTKKNVGIVLAGMPYFKSNLVKFSNKQKEGYAEFYRRVNLWHEMEGLTRQEAEFICTQNGITEPDQVKELSRKKKFGDLANEILLYREQQS